ncbi:hypothetical protein [Actinomadura fibrosa]|uniref:Lipoprotein n=1 Tax=Actinomadura fibrosa TaxID=111802 RepID=A0ABW2XRX7_9ACTN|nr:hypothetical protein [Actinomadura fibrosa]
MRMRTRGALAALPLVLALALTGCGGDDGGEKDGVASAGGGKTGGAAAGGAKLSQEEMGVKFAECMRKNGIPMDDPKDGKILLKIDKKTPKATVDKAMEACRQYNPQANATGAPDPKEQERGRKYAECMRSNGVEAFQDPKPGQRGIMIDGKVAEDPDFKAAQEKCQKILQGGGPR